MYMYVHMYTCDTEVKYVHFEVQPKQNIIFINIDSYR